MPDLDGKRWLLVDDEREYDADRVARSFDDGILALQEEVWDCLMLDHDLGDVDLGKTGYGVCCWLELNRRWCPGVVQLVTSNPVGRVRMGLVLVRIGYVEVVRGNLFRLGGEEVGDGVCG